MGSQLLDKCEALWTNANIHDTNPQNLTTYIEKLGCTYDDIELSDIDYAWHR